MATAAALFPKDSETLRPLAPSPSLLTTTAKLGPLATGKLLRGAATAAEGAGREETNVQGVAFPSSCQCDLRKHATGSWVRGLPPDQDGDLTPSPGAMQLFALGMFRAQEGRSQTPAGSGPDIPEP